METLKEKLLEQAQEISRLRSELVSCHWDGTEPPLPRGMLELWVTEEEEGTRGGWRWIEPPQGHSLDCAGQETLRNESVGFSVQCNVALVTLGLSSCGGK